MSENKFASMVNVKKPQPKKAAPKTSDKKVKVSDAYLDQEMQRMAFAIKASTHRKLRHHCFDQGISMSKYIEKLIEDSLPD